MRYDLSEKQFELFGAIQLFIDCLYSLSEFSPLLVPYRIFCSNANAVSNPNLTADVKQVIEDFHRYFYAEKNIKYMNIGIFDDQPGLTYGNENVSFCMRDVLKSIPDGSRNACIKHVALYVFRSYQGSKDSLGLLKHDADTDRKLILYYGLV